MSDTRPWSVDDLEARVVRYADLAPCYNAFIDCRTPGSEAKENFTIIGPGVSENPEQHVHIAEPHGFNIGGARQPPGCVNSQHSHDTAEVFVVHSGRWTFNVGETGEDARIPCGPGDVISLPTRMFRGFTNVGDDTGYLFAVLGKDDPGHVLWAPDVFGMAEHYGLVLLETGQLVDTVAGQSVPDGARVMPRTTTEQVAALHLPTADEIAGMVWHAPATATGVTPVIGGAGPLSATDDIRLERIDLAPGERFAPAPASAPEVLFIHAGDVEMAWTGGQLTLRPGDTITVPLGLARNFSSVEGAALYRVGG